MKVELLGEKQYELWDELVRHSPSGTIFHSSDWLTTSANFAGKKVSIYGCFNEGSLIAGCSYYVYRLNNLFKIASSTGELTPFGGIVQATPTSTKIREQERIHHDILNSLQEAIAAERFDSVKLVNPPALIDVRPFTWGSWESRIHYTYRLPLDRDLETAVSKNVRRTLIIARRKSVSVEKLDAHDSMKYFPLYYGLFKTTYLRKNLRPPVTEEFLRGMIKLLFERQCGELWIARASSGEIAAAEITAFDNKRLYRWSPASDVRFKETGSPSLLLYEILQDSKSRGFKEVYLMAANTPQLAQFMTSFNPQLVPYFEVSKSTLKYRLARTAYSLFKRIRDNKVGFPAVC